MLFFRESVNYNIKKESLDRKNLKIIPKNKQKKGRAFAGSAFNKQEIITQYN